ncbi:unnamed protein product [Closterium sp. Naga37s-1]|nr:unnamed protein product [Closterium sp. Naga37s-1]
MMTLQSGPAGTAATASNGAKITNNDVSRLPSVVAPSWPAAHSGKFHDSTAASSAVAACGDGMEGVMMMGVDAAGAESLVRSTLAAADLAAAAARRSGARDSLLSQLEKLEAEWTAGSTTKTPHYSHIVLKGDNGSAQGNHHMMDMPSCVPGHVSRGPTGWRVGRINAPGNVFHAAEPHVHNGAAGHVHNGAAEPHVHNGAAGHAHDGTAGLVQGGAAGHAMIDPSAHDMRGVSTHNKHPHPRIGLPCGNRSTFPLLSLSQQQQQQRQQQQQQQQQWQEQQQQQQQQQ